MSKKKIQKYRFASQIAIALICIWMGVEFHFFVKYLESGGQAGFFSRPAGVEAFLPISSLMSLYYFLLTGSINMVHPAGLFIFVGIVAMSLAVGKSFCSWFCPVGLISETIADFGDKVQKKLFKRVLRIPRWLDYPLRSLKYLLLFFFGYAIFNMTAASLEHFLSSPYNVVADVKMYYFFAEMSKLTAIVITVLFVLSILIRNFWCRYLCPYGALLGIASLLSFTKIKRNTATCTDCNACTKVCPNRIDVAKAKVVMSDECSSCMQCVDACPVKNTLEYKLTFGKKPLYKGKIGLAVVVIYFMFVIFGKVSGHWDSNIPKEEYFEHFQNINSIDHPRSASDVDELNKSSNRGALDAKR